MEAMTSRAVNQLKGVPSEETDGNRLLKKRIHIHPHQQSVSYIHPKDTSIYGQ